MVSILWVVAALTRPSELRAGELAWQGPAECNQSEYVSEQVKALTGRSLAELDDYEFEVEIDVTPGPTWHLVLVTKAQGATEQSERRFQGKTCAEVSDAAAVAMAMTLRAPPESSEPAAPVDASPSEPSPSGVVQSETAVRPRSDVAPRRPETRGDDRTLSTSAEVGFAGAFDAGTLPGAGFGGLLRAGVGWQPLRFELEGGLLPPRGHETAPGRGGAFELAFGAALVCYERDFAGPHGLLCVAYELGSLSGEGFGVTEPRLGSTLWQALRTELGANLRLSEATWFSLRAGAAVPLGRRAFVLDRGEVVHRPSAVSARAAAGIEVSF